MLSNGSAATPDQGHCNARQPMSGAHLCWCRSSETCSKLGLRSRCGQPEKQRGGKMFVQENGRMQGGQLDFEICDLKAISRMGEGSQVSAHANCSAPPGRVRRSATSATCRASSSPVSVP